MTSFDESVDIINKNSKKMPKINIVPEQLCLGDYFLSGRPILRDYVSFGEVYSLHEAHGTDIIYDDWAVGSLYHRQLHKVKPVVDGEVEYLHFTQYQYHVYDNMSSEAYMNQEKTVVGCEYVQQFGQIMKCMAM